MNIKDWFGSLDLALRYALAFSVLLGVVLILGTIKVLYNRRRLKKFTKVALPNSATTSEDRDQLAPDEKDESTLFGIRAIEAGYYGGVVQSRPTSLVNTPRSSLAEVSRPPTLRKAQSEYSITAISASSSVLDLEKFDKDHISVMPSNSPTLRPSSRRLIHMASEPILSSNRSTHLKTPSPKALLPQSEARGVLRPSTAQKTGRHSHNPPVLTDLGSHPSLSPKFSDTSSTRAQDTPSPVLPSPRSPTFRHSDTLDYLQMGGVPEDTPEVPNVMHNMHAISTKSNGADSDPFPPVTTPPREKFIRGSIISRASTRSSSTTQRANSPPPPIPSIPPPIPISPPLRSSRLTLYQPQTIPDPPTNIAAFPRQAVISSSNPIFLNFRKQRPPSLAKEDRELGLAAHKSMPVLDKSSVEHLEHTSASNPYHHSVDLYHRASKRETFVFSLPEIRPRSPLRLSTGLTQNSNRTSARSNNPTLDSQHTSFSYTPTLPEYLGYSAHQFGNRNTNLGEPHSPGSNSTTPRSRSGRGAHTDGFFVVNPARVSMKRGVHEI